MSGVRVAVDPAPSPADEQAVIDGLRAFNAPFIGEPDERPLAAFARDEGGRVVGGLLGHTKYGWCYVAKLWVAAEARGAGHGSALLAAAEAEAWARGCLGVHLDTFEYQALPFYQRHGYELFGTLDGYPPGYRQFYVRKLRPGGARGAG
jgi:GNAT superfamily N-acetyltransferase